MEREILKPYSSELIMFWSFEFGMKKKILHEVYLGFWTVCKENNLIIFELKIVNLELGII